MVPLTITYNGAEETCYQMEPSDEVEIISEFFRWKHSFAPINGRPYTPRFPEEISQQFVSLACNLLYKGAKEGIDAFRQIGKGDYLIAEIKGTVTLEGRTDIHRGLPFDELYWLDLHEHSLNKFRIYKLTKSELLQWLNRPALRRRRSATVPEPSQNRRERKNVQLQAEVTRLGIAPIIEGRIGLNYQKAI
jgi:hypothetical protein